MLGRSRSLQIYMKPGIKEDDLMLRVWESCRRHDRPQDVFRSMLRAGLMAMLESGEMPESIIDECGLDALLERRRRRARRSVDSQPAQAVHYPPPYHYPPQPAGHPAPPQWLHPQPIVAPVPVRPEETIQPAPVVRQETAEEVAKTPQAPRADPTPVQQRPPEGGKKAGKGKIGDLM